MLRRLSIGALLLALAGCSGLDYTLAKTDYQDCQWLRIFAFKPACHEYAAPAAAPEIAEMPRFCYRTLGDVECQTEADETRPLVDSGRG